ncbi:MAG: histidinol-phosphate aminotransferase family protein [Prevotellaceae bacterium]|jgi:histidinol-phosphate/aromatic aminotransferase/cobyric acid decarboxylase-like protein|nr:histidinol-phosphate aminotransferase family protein [Prevotellaceae bacterium]
MFSKKIEIKRYLFSENSHSPSLVDVVGEEMLGKIIDFCFIANPYYPDRKLLKDLQRKLPLLIKSYPSSNPSVAQEKLASVLHVAPDSLIIGNGATELISIILNNLIEEIAIPIPTFGEYIEKVRQQDFAKLYQLPPEKDYQLDLQDYASWIEKNNISAALVINPGNPTGQLLPLSEMKEFLRRMEHLRMVIVDESFIDFADKDIPSLLPYIDEFPNLMLLRSMSKHCGVPGLRLGYCCSANAGFLAEIRRHIPSWNINTLAEYFLSQLKRSDSVYHHARLRVIADARCLYNELRKIDGIYVYPTGSNFVMIKLLFGMKAAELQQILLEEYYAYVRDCSNKTGLDIYHIRVASQGWKKDKKLIDALRKIIRNYSDTNR